MFVLPKFFCCISLRTGCIIRAIIGLLVAIGILATSRDNGFQIVYGILYLIANIALLSGAIKYKVNAVYANLILTAIIIVDGLIFGVMFGLLTLKFSCHR